MFLLTMGFNSSESFSPVLDGNIGQLDQSDKVVKVWVDENCEPSTWVKLLNVKVI